MPFTAKTRWHPRRCQPTFAQLARSRVRTWKLRDAKSEKSKEKYKKYSVDWEEEALGSECENGLYASAGRIVHEKRHCDRPIFGIT
jgi:hypothetical protein